LLEGVGRVIRTGRSVAVRLPKDVVVDSAFPFRVGDEVVVQIRSGELRVISKDEALKQADEVLEKQ
jgi:antitoxin component of MazEF toxin-antitoxin module